MIEKENQIPQEQGNPYISAVHADLRRLNIGRTTLISGSSHFLPQHLIEISQTLQSLNNHVTDLYADIENRRIEKNHAITSSLKQDLFIEELSLGIAALFGIFLFTKTIQFFRSRVRGIADNLSKIHLDQIHSLDSFETKHNDEFSPLEHAYQESLKKFKETLIALELKQIEVVNQTKMAALGQMAGGIAHEINNPLAMIDGLLRRIKRNLAENGTSITTIDEALLKTSKHVERISKIVRGLKHISRDASSDPFLSISSKKLLQDTLEFVEEKLRNKSISFELKSTEDFVFECREVQISQILINLINNAADAIATSNNPWIRLEVSCAANMIEFSVTDSGQTPSPEICDKIMQPFFTTKAVGKGTGLGLSISLAIAKAHFGELYLDRSATNTTFLLKIPTSQPKMEIGEVA